MAISATPLTREIQQIIEVVLKNWPHPPDRLIDRVITSLFVLHVDQETSVYPLNRERARKNLLELVTAVMTRIELRLPQIIRPVRDKYIHKKSMAAVCLDHHLSESTFYRLRLKALEMMARMIADKEERARRERYRSYHKFLPSPSYDTLYGGEEPMCALIDSLMAKDRGWTNIICGIGGIGKTALADAVLRKIISEEIIERPMWIRHENQAGISESVNPKVTFENIIRNICREIFPGAGIQPYADQYKLVKNELSKKRFIIVIDNLESQEETDYVVAHITELTNPTKFLITSRTTMEEGESYQTTYLYELSLEDAKQFFLEFARLIGMKVLPTEEDLFDDIYLVIGGNPLAIKLVIGLIDFIPLDALLKILQKGTLQSVEEMYLRIYQQAWKIIGPQARRTLLAMPLVSSIGCTVDTLSGMTGLTNEEVYSAISELKKRSLLEVHNEENEDRYSIHRLTETFLFTDIIGKLE